MYAKTSTLLLRICVYAQIIQRWKTLLSKITLRNFLACTQKNFHLSIKDLPACTNNTTASEDFLIQYHYKNFCACAQKSSMSLLKICAFA